MATIVKLDRQQATNRDNWAMIVDKLKSVFAKTLSQRTVDALTKYVDNQKVASDPVEAFFAGERRFGHKLYTTITRSFKQLKQAMRSGLDGETKSMVNSILEDEIPAKWERIYENGPRNPADYVKKVA